MYVGVEPTFPRLDARFPTYLEDYIAITIIETYFMDEPTCHNKVRVCFYNGAPNW